MSKRKIIKSSRSMTASSGGTTQCQADWTINDTTEYVYAIRVMTTKKGKKRKRKTWASNMNYMKTCSWYMIATDIAEFVWCSAHCTYIDVPSAEGYCELAETVLGCKCKVVKIALREVANDE